MKVISLIFNFLFLSIKEIVILFTDKWKYDRMSAPEIDGFIRA